jgi:hypothetical protein
MGPVALGIDRRPVGTRGWLATALARSGLRKSGRQIHEAPLDGVPAKRVLGDDASEPSLLRRARQTGAAAIEPVGGGRRGSTPAADSSSLRLSSPTSPACPFRTLPASGQRRDGHPVRPAGRGPRDRARRAPRPVPVVCARVPPSRPGTRKRPRDGFPWLWRYTAGTSPSPRGSRKKISTEMSGSRLTWLMNATTGRPMASSNGPAKVRLHGGLKAPSQRMDLLGLAPLNQRALDRGQQVAQHAEDEVLADALGPRLRRSLPEVTRRAA